MRREIKTLVFAEFLVALSLGILGPFYAIFVANIAKDSSTIGYSYAAFWLTVGILSPIFGKLADKHNKKIFLIFGGVLAFSISLLYNFVTSITQLIIIEIVSGIATSLFSPVYRSITAELTSKKNRGAEYGILDGISYITYGVSALLAAAIVTLLGMKLLFVFSAIFQLSSSIFIARKTKSV